MALSNNAAYFRYWGKARRSEKFSGDDYHLLPYHCLDVAASGFRLVMENRFHAADLFVSLGFSLPDGARWFAYFLCFHDIGKFARGFQQLYPHDNAALVPPAGRIYKPRHDTLGYWLWNEYLKNRWLDDDIPLLPDTLEKRKCKSSLDIWLQLITGHHGLPPETAAGGSLAFTKEDMLAAEAFLLEVRQVFPLDIFPARFADKSWRDSLKQQSWLLAGLSVLADWLGSNQNYFPFKASPMPLSEYWSCALERAGAAVTALPTPSGVRPYHGHHDLFPFISQLSPLQQATSDMNIDSGAQLAILEDVTGAGKTESALILAHRLMSQGKADGLYVALPTMATANAMYQRLAHAYKALYEPGCRPSLVLAHGASKMSAAFSQSVWQDGNNGQESYGQSERSASNECNSWFADSRKKSLLAEVGVGTIDQVLMAAMPFRHQSLRLLGIYNKVLILDEVHAYDAYMVRLLEGLLFFHAAQGGSAIILSATLPHSLRCKLLCSFAKGARWNKPVLQQNAGYPWLSQLNGQGLNERQLATREEVKRCVGVNWLTQVDEAITMIELAVKNQFCICWIRNSVDDAITVYRLLQERGNIPSEDLLLFHSRFAFIDRMNIEQKALDWFGKDTDPGLRCGKVLIATQVVEQSLDIDLDLMISDLAPIDLLIQRAGRLQRHIRDGNGRCKSGLKDERPSPVLAVLAPDWQPDAKEGWLGDALKNTGYVYADHACLWRTQAVLRQLGGIHMPEQARVLVETVYEETIEAPTALVAIANKVLGEIYGKRAAAGQSVLSPDKGYDRRASDTLWSDDIELSTRLSEPTLDVYLAYRHEDEIIPYADTDDFPWEKSRIQVRERWWREHCKTLPHLEGESLERFRTRQHRPKGEVLLVEKNEDSDYYSSVMGLLG